MARNISLSLVDFQLFESIDGPDRSASPLSTAVAQVMECSCLIG